MLLTFALAAFDFLAAYLHQTYQQEQSQNPKCHGYPNWCGAFWKIFLFM